MKRRPTTHPVGRKKNRRTKTRGALFRSDVWRLVWTRLWPVCGVVLVLTGVTLALRFGWQSLYQSSRLRVGAIEVLGTERVRWDELEGLSGIHTGAPILTLDLDTSALGMRRHPWIAHATVRRRLPDHITVSVVEHQPKLLVSVGEVYIANADGELFKRLDASDNVVLPVLTGLLRDEVAADPTNAARVIKDSIALAAAMTGGELERRMGTPDEMHWDRDLGWSVVTDRGLCLHLGLDPLARLDRGLLAVKRLQELRRKPSVLWLDAPGEQIRVQASLERTAPSGTPAQGNARGVKTATRVWWQTPHDLEEKLEKHEDGSPLWAGITLDRLAKGR
jgi:hypothetical protein